MTLTNKPHIEKELNKPFEWKALPSARLQPYVQCYRGLIVPPNASASFIKHVIPRGSVALYLAFGCEAFYERRFTNNGHLELIQRPRCSIIGPRTRLLTAGLKHTTDLFVVQFKPGMFGALAGMPVNEIYDEWLSPEELWSRNLGERLAGLEAEPLSERLRSIERILFAHLKPPNIADRSLTHALHLIGNMHGQGLVKSVADRVGLTRRQLARKFQQHVGISPKQTARIMRFSHVIELVEMRSRMSLTEIAFRAGYYDQAHFVRETKQIAGQTPGRLFYAWDAENAPSNVTFLQLHVPE